MARSALSVGPCECCGEGVAPLERLNSQGVRHFVCDPAIRADVHQRVETMRALHRAAEALGTWPPTKALLERELQALPDVATVGDALDALARVRLGAECTAALSPAERQVALSYLDRLRESLR